MIKYNGQTLAPRGIATIKYNGNTYYSGSSPRLPAEYQEVEYLACAASSINRPYIDSGIVPTNMTQVNIKWAAKHDDSNYIFGYRNASNVQIFTISGSSSGGTIFVNVNGTSAAAKTAGVDWHRIDGSWNIYETNLWVVNGSARYTFTDLVNDRVCSGVYNYTLMPEQTEHLYLFYNGKNNLIGENRIYLCQLFTSNVLVRNLVPCYRISDSVAGMYDLASNTFFTNVGTGSFVVGPDVN